MIATPKTIHYVEPYITNPTRSLRIAVIGIGGTGSQMIQRLARINMALKAFDHPGIDVVAVDGDTVSEANIGRQLFPHCDIGMNKARSIIYRVNRFYNTNWTYHDQYVDEDKAKSKFNIIITCVDSVKSRALFKKVKFIEHKKKGYVDREEQTYYHMDLGNDANFGQIIIRNITHFQNDKLPNNHLKKLSGYFDLFPKAKDKKNRGPSCSLAEALKTQDLFINSSIAELGSHMLYNMIRKGFINYNILYLNLEHMAMTTQLK